MNVNIEQIEGNFYWPIIINNNGSRSSSITGAVVTPSWPTDVKRINIKITTIRVDWPHWLRAHAEIYKAIELFIFMFGSFRCRIRHRVVVECKLKF